MTAIAREVRTAKTYWRGRLIEISYEEHWLGGGNYAHLQVQMLEPYPDAAADQRDRLSRSLPRTLPDRRTSWRRFRGLGEVWLNEPAQNRAWRELEEKERQLSLF